MGEVEGRVVRGEKRRIRENKEKGLEKEEFKCVLAFKGQESSKGGWYPNGSVEVRGRGNDG